MMQSDRHIKYVRLLSNVVLASGFLMDSPVVMNFTIASPDWVSALHVDSSRSAISVKRSFEDMSK